MYTFCYSLGEETRRWDLINSFVLSIKTSETKLIITTFNNGSLGSGIDEERSEMR